MLLLSERAGARSGLQADRLLALRLILLEMRKKALSYSTKATYLAFHVADEEEKVIN